MPSVRVLILVAAFLVLGLSSTARAQRAERFLLQGYGGYVYTPDCCQDFIDHGTVAGGLVGVAVTARVWLMGSYSYYWHGGEDGLESWNNQSYLGMLGYDIVPQNSNGNMILFAGAGMFRFENGSDAFDTSSYPALSAGIKVVYDFSRRVAGTVDVGLSVAFAENEFIGGDTWLLPMTLGLAFRL